MSRPRRRGRDINGVLLLDKPQGMSSNDALQKVKRIYNANRAGHTGALDPLATGMLPICLGEATKFSQYLLDSDKRYRVIARLGQRTDTSDADGQIVEERPVTFSAEQLAAALDTRTFCRVSMTTSTVSRCIWRNASICSSSPLPILPAMVAKCSAAGAFSVS